MPEYGCKRQRNLPKKRKRKKARLWQQMIKKSEVKTEVI